MIGKGLLLFNTVKHLKLKQVIYQIYYRLKPAKKLGDYLTDATKAAKFHPLSFTNKITTSGQASASLTFTFLNLTHHFPGTVNWDFQDYGKLWNYNLQYFNYLHQEELPDEVKQALLRDIGAWLADGRLKLEPYPVSLRMMNCLRYFSEKRIYQSELLQQTYAELTYLEQHLEYHIMGNHLLENAFALMMGAHAFENEGWKMSAKAILKTELEAQILNDGAHFELSPMYHQIVLFRVLELIDWYSHVTNPDETFLEFIKNKAERMLGWLQTITFKNGDIPHFSDSTTAIAFTSAQLFQFAEKLQLSYAAKANLDASGYRKYQLNDYECVVDVGAVGPTYQPGHSHADALSFILHYQGRPLFMETGTSTYQIGGKRNEERSTRAHNTVVVEGKDQSEVWGGFRVGQRAIVKVIKETSTEIIAIHDGYKRDFAVIHQRSFTFAPAAISIKDEIVGSSDVRATAYLHFHPHCEVKIGEEGFIRIVGIGNLYLKNAISYRLATYEMADGYNRYKKATVLEADFQGSLETTVRLEPGNLTNTSE
ncbi:MAG: heparinase II/III domain-containing protein [Sphingobacteriaceae bacterium]